MYMQITVFSFAGAWQRDAYVSFFQWTDESPSSLKLCARRRPTVVYVHGALREGRR
jgi:hypothetical protein